MTVTYTPRWADVATALDVLPDALIAYRDQHGLSIRGMAAETGLDEHVLTRIESGNAVFLHHAVAAMTFLEDHG
jgi:transcriptional regulator with XRE-family HTH domain